jgi:hypothetical protein
MRTSAFVIATLFGYATTQATNSDWLTADEKAKEATFRKDLTDIITQIESGVKEAKPIVQRKENYTKTNVKQLERDVNQAVNSAKRINKLYDNAYDYAVKNLNVTESDGWSKLSFNNKPAVAKKFEYAATQEQKAINEAEKDLNRFVNRQNQIETNYETQIKKALDDNVKKIVADVESINKTLNGVALPENSVSLAAVDSDKMLKIA